MKSLLGSLLSRNRRFDSILTLADFYQVLISTISSVLKFVNVSCRRSFKHIFLVGNTCPEVRCPTESSTDAFLKHLHQPVCKTSASKMLVETGGAVQNVQATNRSTHTPRLPQIPLFVATLLLLSVAEFAIPGGLTPRRAKEQILAKRVAEHLDPISPLDPYEVLPGGPVPIDIVHRNGLYHRGVWLFALDSHLRLLLAWRAPSAKMCSTTWFTLGEHAIYNESFLQAASRGLSEEARFIVRPKVFPTGNPFVFHALYDNGTSEQRVDNQWTQTFVVLPRGDALDFRTLDDREAQAEQAAGENSRYQGMSIPDVVRHAVDRPSYFCNAVLSQWILRVIPLVVRVARVNEKRLFRLHLREQWDALIQSGAPVCCNASQHDVPVENVNITECGIPCDSSTFDPTDAIA